MDASQETHMLQAARDALRESASEVDAVFLLRFFKTGPGDYGEGDRLMGVRVPAIRRVARVFKNLSLPEIQSLLASDFHEERLLALIMLTNQYRRGTPEEQARIYALYLANTKQINNWDLVDTSEEHIVGSYLFSRSRKPLYKLARSTSLWERRIAMMATLHFIKKGEFQETLKIARMLLKDREDLIHKAVGWMLREVGNRDQDTEIFFLNKHYQQMPRTMLRYAIEKFPEDVRQQYLKGTI